MTANQWVSPPIARRAALCAAVMSLAWAASMQSTCRTHGAPATGPTPTACPIKVEIIPTSGTWTVGEDVVITCAFTNVTARQLRLRTVDLGRLVNRFSVSIDGAPIQPGRRLGLEFDTVTPRPGEAIGFAPGETLQTKVFLLGGDSVPSGLTDPVTLEIVFDTGPIVVNGDSAENECSVRTNAIDVTFQAPNAQDQDQAQLNALRSVAASRSASGLLTYLEGVENWLAKYGDSTFAPGAHYQLVTGWSEMLDALKRRDLEVPTALITSLRYCLDAGPPYSDVVDRDYLEFLYATRRWELVELAAQRIHDRTKVSRLSDRAEWYIGAWGSLLDSDAFADLDDAWKERLRAPLLRCLRSSLGRCNDEVKTQAPKLLDELAKAKAWSALGQVAQWTESGCGPAVDTAPYLDAAPRGEGGSAPSDVP